MIDNRSTYGVKKIDSSICIGTLFTIIYVKMYHVPMFDYLLFDFDGTIFDTSRGIFKGFDQVVKYYKLDIADKSVYQTMIGPPLKESFPRVFHISDDEIDNAIKVYRTHYEKEGGLFDVTPYDGIVDCIKRLREAGKKIFVATSKPEIYAKQILEKQGMLDLFDFVGGSDKGEKNRVNKVDVIRYVLAENDIKNLEKCLMIGDTHFDVDGARAVGMKCMGVLYGFGTRDELEKAGASCIVDTTKDIADFILSTRL